MISISNINGITVKINKHKLMSIVLVLIMLFPFVPTAFHIYVPIYKNISMAAKIIVFLWVLAMLLLNIKIKLDKYLIVVFAQMGFLLLSTVINKGNLSKYFGFFFDSIAITLIIKYLVSKCNKDFLWAMMWFLRLVMWICVIFLIAYPQGIYTDQVGPDIIRYVFFGLDNQVGPIIIPYLGILIAISYYYNNKITFGCWIDIIMVFSIIIYLWSVTSLVGLVFFMAFLFCNVSNIFKCRISMKSGIIFALVIFVLIVFFRAQELFSFIIVDILHKSMSLSGRTYIWDQAISLILKSPVFGMGIRENESIVYFSIMGDHRHAHCQYFQLMINGGILYTVSFFVGLFNVAKKNDAKNNRKYIWALSMCMVTYLIMCVTDVFSHMYGLYLIMAVSYYGFNNYNVEGDGYE